MPRLDIEIVNRGMAKSRALAQSYIVAGDVEVDGVIVYKASKNINESDVIIIKNKLRYVSRGGLKLEEALRVFGLSAKDAKCLDIGSSTGGFTDCLLQHGASHVTAVDVGSNQLDTSLRNNKKISLYENVDIRDLKNVLENKFDLIVIDISFISLTKVIPYLASFCFDKKKLDDTAETHITKVIALIKPQFEVGKGNLNKNGIVKDVTLYDQVINNIKTCFKENGFDIVDVIESPITGGDGNREFLIYAKYVQL